METLRKKLFFKSHHMGMKETDHIFGAFARECLPALSGEELHEYSILLQNSDVDLKNWVLGYQDPPPYYNTPLFKKLYSHAQKGRA